MCNRQNEPIGLTTLTKHAVLGCATPLFDLMNQGQSILFVGSPGVGKSTILREAARVINDVVMRRVVIVDTCNEVRFCKMLFFSILFLCKFPFSFFPFI